MPVPAIRLRDLHQRNADQRYAGRDRPQSARASIPRLRHGRNSPTAARGAGAALVNQPPRHLQIAIAQLTACVVASHPHFQLFVVAQQQNPRSAPVTASAASTTAESTSWLESEVCKARATSITALSLPSFPPPFSAAGKCSSRRETCSPSYENQLVVESASKSIRSPSCSL